MFMIEVYMKLKPHYDKLLHISITFMLMCFLHAWLHLGIAFLIMAILQVGKIVWNYYDDYTYRPAGDVLANLIGYAIFGLYIWVG